MAKDIPWLNLFRHKVLKSAMAKDVLWLNLFRQKLLKSATTKTFHGLICLGRKYLISYGKDVAWLNLFRHKALKSVEANSLPATVLKRPLVKTLHFTIADRNQLFQSATRGWPKPHQPSSNSINNNIPP